jgi:hypothetical protein
MQGRDVTRLAGAPLRVLCTIIAAGALGPVAGANIAAAQAPSGWSTTGTPGGTATPAAPNTTVVPRALPESASAPLSEVQLEGFLTEDGQRIDQGLVWRVFHGRSSDGRLKLVSVFRDASPKLRLAPGEYTINAAMGRAHLTRQIRLKAGAPTVARFVLNAGGLRISATLTTGEPLPERLVRIEILAGERDQSGERTRVLSGVRPGIVIRLNSGVYHLVSTYGDANAVVRSDVNVEAGKVTEVAVVHQASRATLKLVARAGAEAIADTQWTIATQDGDVVKESVGALPTHILAPGTYVVTARHANTTYRRDVTLTAGEAAEVEVVMQ